MRIFLSYGAVLLALGVLDAAWLTLTKDFYLSKIGHLFAPQVTWWAVALFYLLYAAAVVYFASYGANSYGTALIMGAALGFTAYMTYDLVNMATLAGWPLSFALVDIAWGTIISALAAVAGFAALQLAR